MEVLSNLFARVALEYLSRDPSIGRVLDLDNASTRVEKGVITFTNIGLNAEALAAAGLPLTIHHASIRSLTVSLQGGWINAATKIGFSSDVANIDLPISVEVRDVLVHATVHESSQGTGAAAQQSSSSSAALQHRLLSVDKVRKRSEMLVSSYDRRVTTKLAEWGVSSKADEVRRNTTSARALAVLRANAAFVLQDVTVLLQGDTRRLLRPGSASRKSDRVPWFAACVLNKAVYGPGRAKSLQDVLASVLQRLTPAHLMDSRWQSLLGAEANAGATRDTMPSFAGQLQRSLGAVVDLAMFLRVGSSPAPTLASDPPAEHPSMAAALAQCATGISTVGMQRAWPAFAPSDCFLSPMVALVDRVALQQRVFSARCPPRSQLHVLIPAVTCCFRVRQARIAHQLLAAARAASLRRLVAGAWLPLHAVAPHVGIDVRRFRFELPWWEQLDSACGLLLREQAHEAAMPRFIRGTVARMHRMHAQLLAAWDGPAISGTNYPPASPRSTEWRAWAAQWNACLESAELAASAATPEPRAVAAWRSMARALFRPVRVWQRWLFGVRAIQILVRTQANSFLASLGHAAVSGLLSAHAEGQGPLDAHGAPAADAASLAADAAGSRPSLVAPFTVHVGRTVKLRTAPLLRIMWAQYVRAYMMLWKRTHGGLLLEAATLPRFHVVALLCRATADQVQRAVSGLRASVGTTPTAQRSMYARLTPDESGALAPELSLRADAGDGGAVVRMAASWDPAPPLAVQVYLLQTEPASARAAMFDESMQWCAQPENDAHARRLQAFIARLERFLDDYTLRGLRQQAERWLILQHWAHQQQERMRAALAASSTAKLLKHCAQLEGAGGHDGSLAPALAAIPANAGEALRGIAAAQCGAGSAGMASGSSRSDARRAHATMWACPLAPPVSASIVRRSEAAASSTAVWDLAVQELQQEHDAAKDLHVTETQAAAEHGSALLRALQRGDVMAGWSLRVPHSPEPHALVAASPATEVHATHGRDATGVFPPMCAAPATVTTACLLGKLDGSDWASRAGSRSSSPASPCLAATSPARAGMPPDAPDGPGDSALPCTQPALPGRSPYARQCFDADSGLDVQLQTTVGRILARMQMTTSAEWRALLRGSLLLPDTTSSNAGLASSAVHATHISLGCSYSHALPPLGELAGLRHASCVHASAQLLPLAIGKVPSAGSGGPAAAEPTVPLELHARQYTAGPGADAAQTLRYATTSTRVLCPHIAFRIVHQTRAAGGPAGGAQPGPGAGSDAAQHARAGRPAMPVSLPDALARLRVAWSDSGTSVAECARALRVAVLRWWQESANCIDAAYPSDALLATPGEWLEPSHARDMLEPPTGTALSVMSLTVRGVRVLGVQTHGGQLGGQVSVAGVRAGALSAAAIAQRLGGWADAMANAHKQGASLPRHSSTPVPPLPLQQLWRQIPAALQAIWPLVPTGIMQRQVWEPSTLLWLGSRPPPAASVLTLNVERARAWLSGMLGTPSAPAMLSQVVQAVRAVDSPVSGAALAWRWAAPCAPASPAGLARGCAALASALRPERKPAGASSDDRGVVLAAQALISLCSTSAAELPAPHTMLLDDVYTAALLFAAQDPQQRAIRFAAVMLWRAHFELQLAARRALSAASTTGELPAADIAALRALAFHVIDGLLLDASTLQREGALSLRNGEDRPWWKRRAPHTTSISASTDPLARSVSWKQAGRVWKSLPGSLSTPSAVTDSTPAWVSPLAAALSERTAVPPRVWRQLYYKSLELQLCEPARAVSLGHDLLSGLLPYLETFLAAHVCSPGFLRIVSGHAGLGAWQQPASGSSLALHSLHAADVQRMRVLAAVPPLNARVAGSVGGASASILDNARCVLSMSAAAVRVQLLGVSREMEASPLAFVAAVAAPAAHARAALGNWASCLAQAAVVPVPHAMAWAQLPWEPRSAAAAWADAVRLYSLSKASAMCHAPQVAAARATDAKIKVYDRRLHAVLSAQAITCQFARSASDHAALHRLCFVPGTLMASSVPDMTPTTPISLQLVLDALAPGLHWPPRLLQRGVAMVIPEPHVRLAFCQLVEHHMANPDTANTAVLVNAVAEGSAQVLLFSPSSHADTALLLNVLQMETAAKSLETLQQHEQQERQEQQERLDRACARWEASELGNVVRAAEPRAAPALGSVLTAVSECCSDGELSESSSATSGEPADPGPDHADEQQPRSMLAAASSAGSSAPLGRDPNGAHRLLPALHLQVPGAHLQALQAQLHDAGDAFQSKSSAVMQVHMPHDAPAALEGPGTVSLDVFASVDSVHLSISPDAAAVAASVASLLRAGSSLEFSAAAQAELATRIAQVAAEQPSVVQACMATGQSIAAISGAMPLAAGQADHTPLAQGSAMPTPSIRAKTLRELLPGPPLRSARLCLGRLHCTLVPGTISTFVAPTHCGIRAEPASNKLSLPIAFVVDGAELQRFSAAKAGAEYLPAPELASVAERAHVVMLNCTHAHVRTVGKRPRNIASLSSIRAQHVTMALDSMLLCAAVPVAEGDASPPGQSLPSRVSQVSIARVAVAAGSELLLTAGTTLADSAHAYTVLAGVLQHRAANMRTLWLGAYGDVQALASRADAGIACAASAGEQQTELAGAALQAQHPGPGLSSAQASQPEPGAPASQPSAAHGSAARAVAAGSQLLSDLMRESLPAGVPNLAPPRSSATPVPVQQASSPDVPPSSRRVPAPSNAWIALHVQETQLGWSFGAEDAGPPGMQAQLRDVWAVQNRMARVPLAPDATVQFVGMGGVAGSCSSALADEPRLARRAPQGEEQPSASTQVPMLSSGAGAPVCSVLRHQEPQLDLVVAAAGQLTAQVPLPAALALSSSVTAIQEHLLLWQHTAAANRSSALSALFDAVSGPTASSPGRSPSNMGMNDSDASSEDGASPGFARDSPAGQPPRAVLGPDKPTPQVLQPATARPLWLTAGCASISAGVSTGMWLRAGALLTGLGVHATRYASGLTRARGHVQAVRVVLTRPELFTLTDRAVSDLRRDVLPTWHSVEACPPFLQPVLSQVQLMSTKDTDSHWWSGTPFGVSLFELGPVQAQAALADEGTVLLDAEAVVESLLWRVEQDATVLPWDVLTHLAQPDAEAMSGIAESWPAWVWVPGTAAHAPHVCTMLQWSTQPPASSVWHVPSSSPGLAQQAGKVLLSKVRGQARPASAGLGPDHVAGPSPGDDGPHTDSPSWNINMHVRHAGVVVDPLAVRQLVHWLHTVRADAAAWAQVYEKALHASPSDRSRLAHVPGFGMLQQLAQCFPVPLPDDDGAAAPVNSASRQFDGLANDVSDPAAPSAEPAEEPGNADVPVLCSVQCETSDMQLRALPDGVQRWWAAPRGVSLHAQYHWNPALDWLYSATLGACVPHTTIGCIGSTVSAVLDPAVRSVTWLTSQQRERVSVPVLDQDISVGAIWIFDCSPSAVRGAGSARVVLRPLWWTPGSTLPSVRAEHDFCLAQVQDWLTWAPRSVQQLVTPQPELGPFFQCLLFGAAKSIHADMAAGVRSTKPSQASALDAQGGASPSQPLAELRVADFLPATPDAAPAVAPMVMLTCLVPWVPYGTDLQAPHAFQHRSPGAHLSSQRLSNAESAWAKAQPRWLQSWLRYARARAGAHALDAGLRGPGWLWEPEFAGSEAPAEAHIALADTSTLASAQRAVHAISAALAELSDSRSDPRLLVNVPPPPRSHVNLTDTFRYDACLRGAALYYSKRWMDEIKAWSAVYKAAQRGRAVWCAGAAVAPVSSWLRLALELQHCMICAPATSYDDRVTLVMSLERAVVNSTLSRAQELVAAEVLQDAWPVEDAVRKDQRMRKPRWQAPMSVPVIMSADKACTEPVIMDSIAMQAAGVVLSLHHITGRGPPYSCALACSTVNPVEPLAVMESASMLYNQPLSLAERCAAECDASIDFDLPNAAVAGMRQAAMRHALAVLDTNTRELSALMTCTPLPDNSAFDKRIHMGVPDSEGAVPALVLRGLAAALSRHSIPNPTAPAAEEVERMTLRAMSEQPGAAGLLSDLPRVAAVPSWSGRQYRTLAGFPHSHARVPRLPALEEQPGEALHLAAKASAPEGASAQARTPLATLPLQLLQAGAQAADFQGAGGSAQLGVQVVPGTPPPGGPDRPLRLHIRMQDLRVTRTTRLTFSPRPWPEETAWLLLSRPDPPGRVWLWEQLHVQGYASVFFQRAAHQGMPQLPRSLGMLEVRDDMQALLAHAHPEASSAGMPLASAEASDDSDSDLGVDPAVGMSDPALSRPLASLLPLLARPPSTAIPASFDSVLDVSSAVLQTLQQELQTLSSGSPATPATEPTVAVPASALRHLVASLGTLSDAVSAAADSALAAVNARDEEVNALANAHAALTGMLLNATSRADHS